MDLKLFLSDISEIKQEDFNYKRAYTCRTENKHLPLFGKPLYKVLPIAKVCISGYLMSKYNFDNTEPIKVKYGFTDNQLDSLINPFHRVTFTNGRMVNTPTQGAKLFTVLNHIRKITKRKEWKNDEFMRIVDITKI